MGQALPWVEKASSEGLAALQNGERQRDCGGSSSLTPMELRTHAVKHKH